MSGERPARAQSTTRPRIRFPPSTAENSRKPPADVEGPPAATSEPEPENKRTALTIAPEEVPQSESDQGCESERPAAEGTETEDWLIDFSEEVLIPSLFRLIGLIRKTL